MKIKRSKRYPFLITSIIVAALFGLGLWWNALNTTPQIAIPNPPMPSPNAFDTYKKAYALMVPRPQALYEPDRKTPLTFAEQLAFYRHPKHSAWLAKNGATLKTLRRGFALEYRHPPIRSYFIQFPELARAREMARVLSAESYIKAARGDWDGAAHSAIDILELGHDLPRGAPLIGALSGNGIGGMSYKPLHKVMPYLSAAQCRRAARRLEKIYERRVTFAETMQEEKWMVIASTIETMQKENWQKGLFYALDDAPLTVRIRPRSKRRVIEEYSAYMDKLTVESQKPYARSRPVPQPRDEFANLMSSSIQSSRWAIARAESENALSPLMLALRAYYLEHGAFPEKLDALVPGYLKAIPADPFGDGSALRYKKAGAAYKLWSIGPDGKDDGGRPINNRPIAGEPHTLESSRRHLVLPESTGDMVAGIND